MTRNFAYDPQLASRHFPQLNREYGPYTFLWPKSAKKTRVGADPSVPVLPDGLLVPPVQHLDSMLRRLFTTTEEATVVIDKDLTTVGTPQPYAHASSTNILY